MVSGMKRRQEYERNRAEPCFPHIWGRFASKGEKRGVGKSGEEKWMTKRRRHRGKSKPGGNCRCPSAIKKKKRRTPQRVRGKIPDWGVSKPGFK